MSFDNTDDAEIATSINVTKESTVTTVIFMPIEDDKPWFDAHEEFDLWYDTLETMDNYKKIGRSTKHLHRYKYHQ